MGKLFRRSETLALVLFFWVSHPRRIRTRILKVILHCENAFKEGKCYSVWPNRRVNRGGNDDIVSCLIKKYSNYPREGELFFK